MRSRYEFASLPDDCLATIFGFLPHASQQAFALTNKRLNVIYRNLCTEIYFCAESAEDLKSFALSQFLQSFPKAEQCTLALSHSQTSNLGCLAGINAPSLRDLTVEFAAGAPSRGCSFTHLLSFEALTSLTLGLGSPLRQTFPHTRLNLNGGFYALAFLPNLRNLNLSNLGSDKGLDQLHQVTSLRITFPNHGEAELDNFCCSECDIVHFDTVADYLISTARDENEGPIILGHAIKHMQNLQELYLDFNCNSEVSVNCLVNAFRWNENSDTADDTRVAGQPTNPIWPSLTTVSFQRTGLIARETFEGIQEIGSDVVHYLKIPGHGLDIWKSARIMDAFCCMPMLETWRLHIDEEQDELNYATRVYTLPDSDTCGIPCLYGKVYVDVDGDEMAWLEVARPAGLTTAVRLEE